MTLGVMFNQKLNKASEPEKRVFYFHGYFFDLNWCHVWYGYTTCLSAVELGSIPLWHFGHVLNDQTCHEATRNFKFAGLYGST